MRRSNLFTEAIVFFALIVHVNAKGYFWLNFAYENKYCKIKLVFYSI